MNCVSKLSRTRGTRRLKTRRGQDPRWPGRRLCGSPGWRKPPFLLGSVARSFPSGVPNSKQSTNWMELCLSSEGKIGKVDVKTLCMVVKTVLDGVFEALVFIYFVIYNSSQQSPRPSVHSSHRGLRLRQRSALVRGALVVRACQ